MKKPTVFITALLIVVLLLAVVSIRVFFAGKRDAAPAETVAMPTPIAVTQAPATEAPQVTEALHPSPTPIPVTQAPVVPTHPPVSTPAPTPPPTPAPVPATASGSFSSATGTYLNLVVNWKAYEQGGAKKLKVDLAASSYAFYTDALWNALELKVNGTTYSANSPAVKYDGKELHSTPLATFTVDAPTGSVSLSAVWHYKGSYSGVDLEDISAAGTIYIP